MAPNIPADGHPRPARQFCVPAKLSPARFQTDSGGCLPGAGQRTIMPAFPSCRRPALRSPFGARRWVVMEVCARPEENSMFPMVHREPQALLLYDFSPMPVTGEVHGTAEDPKGSHKSVQWCSATRRRSALGDPQLPAREQGTFRPRCQLLSRVLSCSDGECASTMT